MIHNIIKRLAVVLGLSLLASTAFSSEDKHSGSQHAAPKAGPVCSGFGPQTPRDIDSIKGTNSQSFTIAPKANEMNLCNIHFHNNAEHKAAAFSIYAGEGEHGHGGGYQCQISKHLSKSELTVPSKKICKGLKPGDTIEVHWVHSSCQIKPGATLGSCLSKKCANPDLRVETQVFTLVNDPKAMNFNDFGYGGNMVNGLHQAKALPKGTGHAIDFTGSTTGPKYTESTCSPYQVTWAVRPKCAKLDINSIGEWCEGNDFSEDHAHGVRKLVTNPKLLSNIK
ncbi:MAG: delta-class carbonic anhydrase [Woeseiaceae bacterium]